MGSPVFVGIQRILLAFDASPHAERALDVALSMAGDMKAKLFVISVIRPPNPPRAWNSIRPRYVTVEPPVRKQDGGHGQLSC
jgi:nucleotide-binding universal stress UspA family protein